MLYSCGVVNPAVVCRDRTGLEAPAASPSSYALAHSACLVALLSANIWFKRSRSDCSSVIAVIAYCTCCCMSIATAFALLHCALAWFATCSQWAAAALTVSAIRASAKCSTWCWCTDAWNCICATANVASCTTFTLLSIIISLCVLFCTNWFISTLGWPSAPGSSGTVGI